MSDYISREEALEIFGDIHPLDHNANAYKSKIEKLPSVDVRENIHGHWELKYPTREEIIYCQERYFCSNCKGYVVDRIERLEFNFCPNCGADMRKENNETDNA